MRLLVDVRAWERLFPRRFSADSGRCATNRREAERVELSSTMQLVGDDGSSGVRGSSLSALQVKSSTPEKKKVSTFSYCLCNPTFKKKIYDQVSDNKTCWLDLSWLTVCTMGEYVLAKATFGYKWVVLCCCCEWYVGINLEHLYWLSGLSLLSDACFFKSDPIQFLICLFTDTFPDIQYFKQTTCKKCE